MMIGWFIIFPNRENQQNLQKSLIGPLATLCRFYTPPLVVGGDKSRQRSSASFASLFLAIASFSVIYLIVRLRPPQNSHLNQVSQFLPRFSLGNHTIGVISWQLWQNAVGSFGLISRRLTGLSSIAYTLCSNQPTYLPKFANLNFLENTTPSATLKNVILRFWTFKILFICYHALKIFHSKCISWRFHPLRKSVDIRLKVISNTF